MKIIGIFFVSYFVFVLGYESDEFENRKVENRRFVPMYPYSENLKSSPIEQLKAPRDSSLTPMKAPRELVDAIAARSKHLQEPLPSYLQDQAQQRRLRTSGQYWDRLWFEPQEDGRRLDGEVPAESEVRKLPTEEPASNAPVSSTEYSAVPDIPQSISENNKPARSYSAPSYVPSFSMINYGKDEHENDDIEVKAEVHQVPAQKSTSSTSASIFDKEESNLPTFEQPDNANPIRPIKNNKEDKSTKKTDKLVISLPGAEIQGAMKAKLVPGTKLYKLMKNAKKRLGENYQPKLLYVVNNYKNQNNFKNQNE